VSRDGRLRRWPGRRPAAGLAGRQDLSAHSALLFTGNVAGNVGFFVAALMMARWLTVGGRGTVAFVSLTALLLGRVTRLGVLEATSVLAASHIELRRSLFTNLLLWTAVTSSIAGAGMAAGIILSDWHIAGMTPGDAVALGLSTPAVALQDAITSFLIGVGRIATASLMRLVEPWCWAAGLGLLEATGTLAPATCVGAWGVSMAVSIAVRIPTCLRIAPLTRPSLELLRRALRFGLPAWVGSISTTANFRLDQILMGFLSTQVALGVYAVAVNCSEMLLYLPTATASALMPLIARTAAAERGTRILRSYRATMLVTVVATLGAFALGPFLIPLVFGSQYQASVVPFVVLSLGSVGWVAMTVLSSGLLGASAAGYSSLGSMVSLTTGTILDFALIPSHGAIGAAIAATFAFFAGGAASIVAFRRRHPFRLAETLPNGEDARWLVANVRGLLQGFLPAESIGEPVEQGQNREQA
jgi:O-antigen/teichoic acid export membrane protein